MNYSSNANRPKTGLFTLDKCVVPFAKKNGDSSKAISVFSPNGVPQTSSVRQVELLQQRRIARVVVQAVQ